MTSQHMLTHTTCIPLLPSHLTYSHAHDSCSRGHISLLDCLVISSLTLLPPSLQDIRKAKQAKEKKDRYGKGRIASTAPPTGQRGTINGEVNFNDFDTRLVKKGDPLPDTLNLDRTGPGGGGGGADAANKTKVFNYSIPRMTIALSQTPGEGGGGAGAAADSSSALLSKSTSNLKNTAISPIKRRPNSTTNPNGHGSGGGNQLGNSLSSLNKTGEHAAAIQSRRSKVLDRLKTSPFLPQEGGFRPVKSSKTLPPPSSSSGAAGGGGGDIAIKKEKTDWALRLEVLHSFIHSLSRHPPASYALFHVRIAFNTIRRMTLSLLTITTQHNTYHMTLHLTTILHHVITTPKNPSLHVVTTCHACHVVCRHARSPR